ncbi:MAG: hypothetical protein DRI34_06200 [Deltaproteobacteria bacterium]|nr:MAG: hypothetical protein DRI34_06200 [Deltaproteobacteria bacterium]
MAGKEELPHYKEKQAMLHGKEIRPEQLVEVGKRQLAAGWYSDAIDFFARAEYREGLEQVRRVAIEEGDVFLLRKILRAGAEEADDEQWQRLADNARRLGKLEFAREGYRLAGNRKALDEVDRMINPPPEEPVEASYDEE